jgi:hypothetical protein
MTDREMLELAAKAAGYAFGHYHDKPAQLVKTQIGDAWIGWSPLADDGDALRLAVKCGIEYGFGYNDDGTVQRCIVYDILHVLVENNDPYAATRRAIVRAAAEIGRAMP